MVTTVPVWTSPVFPAWLTMIWPAGILALLMVVATPVVVMMAELTAAVFSSSCEVMLGESLEGRREGEFTWTDRAGLLVAPEFWRTCWGCWGCWPDRGPEIPTTTAWAGWVGKLTVVAARGLAV